MNNSFEYKGNTYQTTTTANQGAITYAGYFKGEDNNLYKINDAGEGQIQGSLYDGSQTTPFDYKGTTYQTTISAQQG
ncbi:MAG: hypothetical protein V2B18_19450, partial [Pseudomonadota bacterium]